MEGTTLQPIPITPAERRRYYFACSVSSALAPFLRRFFPKLWERLSNLLLHGSAHIGDVRLLTRWLEFGTAPDIRESILQSTPLMAAASQGHISVIELLLKAGADVNAQDQHGGTALICAAEFGQVEAVQLLLDAGAEIDAVESGFGHTALFKAVTGGHLNTVRLLVEYGADTTLRMRARLTAPEWARQMAQSPMPHASMQLACAKYLESL